LSDKNARDYSSHFPFQAQSIAGYSVGVKQNPTTGDTKRSILIYHLLITELQNWVLLAFSITLKIKTVKRIMNNSSIIEL